jgi:hypothetical protein
MKIIDDELHRTLKYVVSVCDTGHPGLFHEEVEALRKDRSHRAPATFRSIAMVQAMFAEQARDHTERLRSLNWITVDPVRPTPLGRAVLGALEAEEARLDVETDVAEVMLDSDDEFVIPRLIGQLASVGEYLLVDPYLRVDNIPALVRRTAMRRVLVSEKLSRADRAALAQYIEQQPGDEKIQARVAPADRIHDRYVVGEDAVLQLGTSMNAIGTTTTVMTKLQDVADSVRGRYEDLWEEARPLESD